jgi:N-acyl homoserine lactone hydrolase
MVVPRSALVVSAVDDGTVRIPAPAFLVEHRDGIVLFDAGLAPEAAADPRRVYGERADRLQLRYAPEQRVDRQVHAAGHQPEDVTVVVLSHLHFDHAGSAHLFPAAQVLVGAGELAHARAGADSYCRAEDVARVAGCRPNEVAADTDLFGDGSVVVLRTPGHTPGHLSLLVRLPDRAYLLTGDAVHTRSALISESPFPHDDDPVAAVASIRRVKELANESGAAIWVSHDPDDWARWARSC